MADKIVQNFRGDSTSNPSEAPVTHSITLKAGLNYEFYDGAVTAYDRADTTLRIYDEATGVYSFARNYNYYWTQDRTGTFTLSIDPSSSYDDWAYNLILDKSDVVRNDVATTNRILDGGDVDGRIDVRGDVDVYSVDAVAGRTYTITLDHDIVGDDLSYGRMSLLDGKGQPLFTDATSTITHTADETGKLFVSVDGKYSDTGAFNVSVLSDAYAMTGTQRDDKLQGGAEKDDLDGGGGNDTIDGGAGDDAIGGGIGFDVLSGGDGDDRLIGANGFDTLSGGAGSDKLEGSFGNDVLFGDGGNDYLNGGLGFDRMEGGEGNDTLDALDGYDTLRGGNGDDVLNGNAGNDRLFGDEEADRVNGGIGADTLSGGAGSDTLLGGNGADLLEGGTGADVLNGNAGADRLDGGAGNDKLFGGIGIDEFVFSTGSGQDMIMDLGTVDRVSLDADLVGNAALGSFETTVGDDLALAFGGGNVLIFFGYDSVGQIAGQIDLI